MVLVPLGQVPDREAIARPIDARGDEGISAAEKGKRQIGSSLRSLNFWLVI
jgi:hypothetical protein